MLVHAQGVVDELLGRLANEGVLELMGVQLVEGILSEG